jgi:uncharacterized membrane protein YoaK (UPF0700 family)
MIGQYRFGRLPRPIDDPGFVFVMMRYQRREIALAACFSALAGYVDALGFITLGGYFVSFMTGNTTRLGIELAGGHAGGAALLETSGATLPAVCLLAVAMGTENAVFQRDGEVTIGLTYMTGTLVKMGQRIAAAMLGGPKRAFLRHFLLWLGLMGGAFLGAAVHGWIGLTAIWLAAAAAAAMTVAATFFLRDG